MAHCSCNMTKSFRQVPTFGADTIRRFSSNVSELKRLAARDFEDILQVRRFYRKTDCVDADLRYFIFSVPYRFSTAFFLSHTIAPFYTYSSPAHIGMGWRSFACTQIRRLTSSMIRQST